MTQAERLQKLGEAIIATTDAFDSLGMNVFLESATLIGWWRHNETHMPWDTDTDVGMLREQCDRVRITKEKLQKQLSPPYKVVKFGCTCLEDCEGDSERIAGRVADTSNGFFVDIFSYERIPEEEAPSWMEGKIFRRRIADRHSNYVFPESTLLPLQDATFDNHAVHIPAEPESFLSWEYGQCLGVHLYPWRFFLYSPVPLVLHLSIFTRIAISFWYSRKLSSLMSLTYHIVAVYYFDQGPLLLCYLCFTMTDLLFLEFKVPVVSGALLLIFNLLGIAYAFRGSIQQLACHIAELWVPLKPEQFFTICLFDYCHDFYVS